MKPKKHFNISEPVCVRGSCQFQDIFNMAVLSKNSLIMILIDRSSV